MICAKWTIDNRDTAFCSFLKHFVMIAMRKMLAVMLMVSVFTAAQTRSDAQSRARTDRKPAATANYRKPSVPSSGSHSRPNMKPGNKPSMPAARPTTPGARPVPPSARPVPPSAKPSGPSTRPDGGPAHRPAPGPGGPGYRPGFRPGYKPAPMPPRPKPIIVVRPSYGSVIAASIASRLALSAVRAATRPIYVTVPSDLRLTHSYVASGTEYYYQDGVFYIVDSTGQFRTIVPPTGALVEYLPEDYTTFRRDGNMYYRVDDTVYAVTLVSGSPYFEVLGQLY